MAAPGGARASTRSTATAVPISTRSTPSAARSDVRPRSNASPPAAPPNDAAAPRRSKANARTATAMAASLRSRRQPCGSTPRNWSRSSPGAPSRANSASATGLLNSLTVTWPCPRTSARPPRPAFSHCEPKAAARAALTHRTFAPAFTTAADDFPFARVRIVVAPRGEGKEPWQATKASNGRSMNC